MSLWQFTQSTRGWISAHVPKPDSALDRSEIANLGSLLDGDAMRGNTE